MLATASRYAEATRIIHADFNTPWSKQLRVVQQRGDTLVIYAASAAATIRAKAYQQALIDSVSPLFPAHPPRRLRIDVVPPFDPSNLRSITRVAPILSRR